VIGVAFGLILWLMNKDMISALGKPTGKTPYLVPQALPQQTTTGANPGANASLTEQDNIIGASGTPPLMNGIPQSPNSGPQSWFFPESAANGSHMPAVRAQFGVPVV